jgi:putative ABC transport system permease protein
LHVRALLKALRRNNSGPLLVGAQVAITLAVLVNVSYMVRQNLADLSRPTGLDLDNMFWLSMQPTSSDYNYAPATRADLMYLNSRPDVIAATTASGLPQGGGTWGLEFAPSLEALERPGGTTDGLIYFGTDRFLDALGLKLVSGRNFKPEEVKAPPPDGHAALGEWAPEIIVTRALADKLFPNQNALGQVVYASLIHKSATIIGIVQYMQAHPASARFEDQVERIVIVPMIAPGPDAAYVVRARPGQRSALMARLEQSFASLQPGRFLSWIESYTVTFRNAREGMRANAIILAVVAVCVLAITVVGISGLAAFNVTKRTRQLGIRRAIGASRSQILSLVLLENLIITSFGILLGIALTLISGLELSRIYDLPLFPWYYLPVAAVLLWCVSLLAVLLPAMRAASIPPALATRSV